ncbi:hypothetical protein BKA69DRAFT_1067539 [Paraphysoderma sedebokerense]|nr:hypothetical protein BKA69DRAFT_1067539 [Paraphysoderma sedebokerense]
MIKISLFLALSVLLQHMVYSVPTALPVAPLPETPGSLRQRLGLSIESNYAKLPKKGSLDKIPWAASYYPQSRDGANVLWAGNGTQSAISKYATVYGLNATLLEDFASILRGIDYPAHTECRQSSDCSNGAKCVHRRGQNPATSIGRCVEGWTGLCHAWAPASLLEDEPLCPVTMNGVTFEINDLKALILMAYENPESTTPDMIGLKCNSASPERDVYNRSIIQECADMNAGTFHLVTSNLLGVHKKGFVGELSTAVQVWNYPIYSFNILNETEFTPEKAMSTFFPNRGNRYAFNDATRSVQYVQLDLKYTTESSESDNVSWTKTGTLEKYLVNRIYEYILELDDQKNIIGGEWVRNSLQNHPDFLWFSKSTPPANLEIPSHAAAQGTVLKYSNIKDLLRRSVEGQC